MAMEEKGTSLNKRKKESKYGSLPSGWSEEVDKYGHTMYVSDYTNEKEPGLSLTVCLSDYLSVCLSVYLSVCLSVCLSGSPGFECPGGSWFADSDILPSPLMLDGLSAHCCSCLKHTLTGFRKVFTHSEADDCV